MLCFVPTMNVPISVTQWANFLLPKIEEVAMANFGVFPSFLCRLRETFIFTDFFFGQDCVLLLLLLLLFAYDDDDDDAPPHKSM